MTDPQHVATGPAGTSPAGPVAVVVVAGGRGRRLGGVDKPALRRDGRTLLDRLLAVLPPGATVVVVGPERELPDRVRVAREDPPGGGPAAAVAAGVGVLSDLPDDATVVLLAGDLAAPDPATVPRLEAGTDGRRPAVAVDSTGRRQYLCSAWPLALLRRVLATRSTWQDRGVGELFAAQDPALLVLPDDALADVDRPEDLTRWGVDPTDTPPREPAP